MDNQFRNAAFGGFNRQDVMEYLERTAREHSEELAQLRARLDEAQNQCNALAARADSFLEAIPHSESILSSLIAFSF